jgi:hypothetical protein
VTILDLATPDLTDWILASTPTWKRRGELEVDTCCGENDNTKWFFRSATAFNNSRFSFRPICMVWISPGKIMAERIGRTGNIVSLSEARNGNRFRDLIIMVISHIYRLIQPFLKRVYFSLLTVSTISEKNDHDCDF